MGSKQYDTIIIGCGIAGATLSWQLHARGHRLLVVDNRSAPNASQAAAGVISPITGKRHTAVWRWQEFWPQALSFYQQLESLTDSSLLRLVPQLRFLAHQPSQELLERARALGSYLDNKALRVPDGINNDMGHYGAIEIQSAVVNVSKFLDTTFDMLNESHRVYSELLPYEAIECLDDGFAIQHLDAFSKQLVFCEGAQASQNPWFDCIQFESVRGESLAVHSKDLPANHIYQRDISLTPTQSNTFLAGATYDWQDLESGPTQAGATLIREKIAQLLSGEFTVTAHRSGVRPVVKGRRPVVVQHPSLSGLWLFNGLASRGCLQAPYLAKQLASAICDGAAIDSCFTYDAPKERFPTGHAQTKLSRDLRLTTLAQRIVQDAIEPGDIVVDATAGNGNDTFFLATCTGPDGKVFAFDLQPLALQRTAKRLSHMRHEHVELLLHDHAEAFNVLPAVCHGNVAAAMFNLGYLPGSDQNKTTQPSSTCKAVSSLLSMLRPTGICTILCYRGHPGGAEETNQVSALLTTLPVANFTIETYAATPNASGPILLSVRKH